MEKGSGRTSKMKEQVRKNLHQSGVLSKSVVSLLVRAPEKNWGDILANFMNIDTIIQTFSRDPIFSQYAVHPKEMIFRSPAQAVELLTSVPSSEVERERASLLHSWNEQYDDSKLAAEHVQSIFDSSQEMGALALQHFQKLGPIEFKRKKRRLSDSDVEEPTGDAMDETGDGDKEEAVTLEKMLLDMRTGKGFEYAATSASPKRRALPKMAAGPPAGPNPNWNPFSGPYPRSNAEPAPQAKAFPKAPPFKQPHPGPPVSMSPVSMSPSSASSPSPPQHKPYFAGLGPPMGHPMSGQHEHLMQGSASHQNMSGHYNLMPPNYVPPTPVNNRLPSPNSQMMPNRMGHNMNQMQMNQGVPNLHLNQQMFMPSVTPPGVRPSSTQSNVVPKQWQ
eukprot:Platyproteum_vivax@DN2646_c0_g1_i1.p1